MKQPTPDNQLGYPSLARIVPEDKAGPYEVRHTLLDEDRIYLDRLVATYGGHGWMYQGLVPGTYAVLTDDRDIIMSDTYLERSTNNEVCQQANGNVLIAGLGIGLILTRILPKPEVTTVTVIEKSQAIIDLVAAHHAHPKLQVLLGDVFEYEAPQRYDTIYFDIWPNISGDNYEATKDLHKRYRKWLNRKNPRAYMNSWVRDYIKKQYHKVRRQEALEETYMSSVQCLVEHGRS